MLWLVALTSFGVSLLGTIPMTGPLAVLVLDRSLRGRARDATVIAAAGSATEGTIAFGVAWVLSWLLGNAHQVLDIARLLGAAIVTVIGLILLVRPNVLGGLDTDGTSRSALGGVTATALNPTLFATWTVALTTLRAHGLRVDGPLLSGVFGVGVALGSFVWLVLVVSVTRRFGSDAVERHRASVIRTVGGLLTAAGASLLVKNLWA